MLGSPLVGFIFGAGTVKFPEMAVGNILVSEYQHAD